MEVLSENGSGWIMVNSVVGQGSTKVITNEAEADFNPTEPIITKVY